MKFSINTNYVKNLTLKFIILVAATSTAIGYYVSQLQDLRPNVSTYIASMGFSQFPPIKVLDVNKENILNIIYQLTSPEIVSECKGLETRSNYSKIKDTIKLEIKSGLFWLTIRTSNVKKAERCLDEIFKLIYKVQQEYLESYRHINDLELANLKEYLSLTTNKEWRNINSNNLARLIEQKIYIKAFLLNYKNFIPPKKIYFVEHYEGNTSEIVCLFLILGELALLYILILTNFTNSRSISRIRSTLNIRD